jgi:MoxR-like ATPase
MANDSTFGFELLDPDDRDAEKRRSALAQRSLPPTLGNHREAAQHYQPDGTLVDAVNVAFAVGAPLLLTGEPGTGKTQVAHYLAWYFDIKLFPLYVRSDTTAEHLLYSFDAVAYLHGANDPAQRGKLTRGDFVEPGPLWRAYQEKAPAVVLIDEIDKASRDFPNDLLHVLDQHEFYVREKDMTVSRGTTAPPMVVITSNSERRLPEPFLRRCIFHHIEFTEELVRRAVDARLGDFPQLSSELRDAAIQRFLELRGREIRKPPATAELLVWLTVLSARGGVTLDELRNSSLAQLPAMSALVKDRDDLKLLGR